MRHDNRDTAYFDCQSAALLALTRAAGSWTIRAFSAAVERGLAAYGLTPARSTCRNRARSTPSRWPRRAAGDIGETAFWNFKAGLALRFFAALRNSPEPAVQAIAARHRRPARAVRGDPAASAGASITEHAAASNSVPRSFRARPIPRPSPGPCSGWSAIPMIDRAHPRTRPAVRRALERQRADTDRCAVRGGVHRPPPVSPARSGRAAQFFAVTETELPGRRRQLVLARRQRQGPRIHVAARGMAALSGRDPGDAALRALDVPGAVHVPPGQHAAAGTHRRRRRAAERGAVHPFADACPARPAAGDGGGRGAVPRHPHRRQPAAHRQCRALYASRPPLFGRCRGRGHRCRGDASRATR